jgi:hydrogenase-1 operon protein HyaE
MTIPMLLAAHADARASPQIARLFTQHGFAEVTVAGFAEWRARSGRALLVFLEDPGRFKETLDLAVIAPELARAFAGRFCVGVALPEAARELSAHYGFRRWPALVMLADGRYVGAIDGLRSWDEYLTEMGRLLAAPPTRPPAVGIAIVNRDEAEGNCHA